MPTRVAVVLAYFAGILIVGLLARSRAKSTPEDYFLADRKLGPLLLVATMAATNFSAFTVFGTSGAGYRDGYSFFPIMGFGTGFMALSFWVLGRKIRQIGIKHNTITPSELIGSIYKSPFLSMLFAIVMIAFTIPYLALQPMAAGYALEELLGLPYMWGCCLVTSIIVAYTLCGGMRAVVWTDLLQGTFMALLLLVALGTVSLHHGGFIAANRAVMESVPELFSRPGGAGTYTLGIWFSYMLLWFFCDPMFPQLFQRFFSARDERALSLTMLLYPLICSFIFFLPVSMGVLGHLSFPGLTGSQSDRIIPMMLTAISGDFMASLIIAAALAALMSTMDSQLLTLSSIFSRDILPVFSRKTRHGDLAGKVFVVVLASAGLVLAYRPPETILILATQTFSGLAVLFPTVFFGLYLKRVFPLSAILSIATGEATLLGFYLGWLSPGPFLPVIWVMLVAFSSYLAIHFATAWKLGIEKTGSADWLKNPYVFLSAGLFVLAMDIWNWNRSLPTLWSIPLWVWYFGALSVLQTLMMFFMTRRKKDRVHNL
ncbi:MAG TPA: sodium:solute symporter family protein [Thermovirgaceae bacterium]|jgi:SSS family solute:Na+ symporter|nr:sodium:solute symporter family protein [Thermovirgaceae bacterium]